MCTAAGLTIVRSEGSVQRYVRAKEVELILQRAHDANEAAHLRIDDLVAALKGYEEKKQISPVGEAAEVIRPLGFDAEIPALTAGSLPEELDYT